MKFRKESPDEVLSLLGEGLEISGELSFSRALLVDGVVKGKIRSEGCLMIGAKGRVEADVTIQRITINGEFHGAIHAAERVEIHKEGRVYGELYTPCLIIEAGALFEGKCNMGERKATGQPEGSSLESFEATAGNASAMAAEKSWGKRTD